MPTYLYKCPIHGEFEIQHSITEELQYCPHCINDQSSIDEPCEVKRLISGGSNFILVGSGWAKDNYSG